MSERSMASILAAVGKARRLLACVVTLAVGSVVRRPGRIECAADQGIKIRRTAGASLC